MKLKSTSITATLYKMFYGTWNLPKSLCPYFWQVVLMYILLIPSAIFCIPYHILRISARRKYIDDSYIFKMLLSFLLYLVIFTVGACIYTCSGYITWLLNGSDPLLFTDRQAMGLVISLCILLIIFGLLIKFLISKIASIGTYKQKEPSLIKEFIKAKYNKYCPKIDWE